MNHDYNTPQAGSLDWNIPLNDNFRTLDVDVEIRDIESNIANYTPANGAKFFATDTNAVFLGDGSNWTRVGTIRDLPGDVYVQSQAPANPTAGDLWIDTGSN